MDASVSSTSQNDETERGDGDVWSDLETLKNLYGLLDKTPGTNTERTSEEILDHRSKVYLMRLLDEATQNTLTNRMKTLPGPSTTPQLASFSSSQRSNQINTENPEQKNLKNIFRHSFQTNNSNIYNSQFSEKSRRSQAPAHINHPMSRYNVRSGTDRASKPVIGKSRPMYGYHKENSLYCPSERRSRSGSHNARTESRPGRVHPDRMSSRVKSRNRYRRTANDCCSDSSELNSGRFDHQGKLTRVNKRMILRDRRKDLKDNLSVDSGSQSDSVSVSRSESSSSNSNSSSKGSIETLPIVPFKNPSISQHENNKSLQRTQSTRKRTFVNQRKNSKKLGEEITDKPLEKKKGRFERLKNKLAVVFHHRHDHQHFHHHNHRESKNGAIKGRQRSLWKYLKGIVHRSSEQRHLSALFGMLFGHFWGNKGRKKVGIGRMGSGIRVGKVRWWHRFRTGRRMKVAYGKKPPRLPLPYSGKGGSTKKGNKR